MSTGKRNRRALQDRVRLRSKLDEVALREEVREEFDVLDKQGVPLPKQPARATAAVIDARTIEEIKGLVPTELLEVLVDEKPPASGSRTTRALGRMDAIVRQTQSRSRAGREGAAWGANANFNREVEEALAEIQLPTKRGERRAAAEKHLKDNHVVLWKGRRREGLRGVESLVGTVWFRERMRQSQKLHAERLTSKTPRLAKNRR